MFPAFDYRISFRERHFLFAHARLPNEIVSPSKTNEKKTIKRNPAFIRIPKWVLLMLNN